ncbi:MAG: carbohydrate ABC transporter permease [Ruminococcus sp.]|nr:carbohydrate ABC transporter permease [Ruminococcus sp.]
MRWNRRCAVAGTTSPEKMSRKQLKKLRMQGLSREERGYLRRKAAADKVWPLFRFVILFGLSFVILYPLIYMVSCAFRDRSDMSDPTVMWITRHHTIDVIKDTMKAMNFWETLRTTLLLNIGCALVQVISCAITGYGFARFDFRGKKLLFGIVIMMILVPMQVIALPLYTQFRFFLGRFNLIDTMWAMYLPAMTGNGIRSGLMILIFRQFFRGLPKEIEDAAYIDGCGPLRTFIQVMVPNAASAFLTVFLFSVVWYWNDYYVSMTFFVHTETVATMLTNLDSRLGAALFNNATIQIDEREKIVWKEAGCLLSIAPLIIMYIFLQKYFTEGIERSGLVA